MPNSVFTGRIRSLTLIEDPIVNEIRLHREAHAAKYGNDLQKICDALRERQEKSDREVVKRKPHYRLHKTGS